LKFACLFGEQSKASLVIDAYTRLCEVTCHAVLQNLAV
jgi:hypothetical protein